MLVEERLPTLIEAVIKQFLFFGRSEIQSQLLAIALALALSWLLSKCFWHWLVKTFPQASVFIWDDARFSCRQYLAVLLQHLDFSVISLIVLNLTQELFRTQDWKRGLLSVAIRLMWVYLGYRFCLASLYAVFPLASVRQYHYRLFAPLFILYVLGTISNLANNLELIAQISPFKLFNSPFTLSSIFILITGLYFWVVIVILLENTLLKILETENQLETGTTQATLLLIRYFLIALGIVIILGYVGVNGTAVAAITGGLSVGIGFGLQQVVSNFVSGILLLFEGVLRPGDIIEIEGQTCEVTKLGIRATTVKILKNNSERIIPNQTFFTKDLTTYTSSDRLVQCSIKVGVGYEYEVNQITTLFLRIANEEPRILKKPAPLVFLLNFGDSHFNFELKFWLNNINLQTEVISALNYAILENFTKSLIEAPFSQREIHIRTGG
ncbi:mechanosensitive ion channel family protein [Chroococcus sp. FPU101]|uniref:mechanosensitive ion channel family protein n=1 Tax=Chroococcus sp. FPU101 TaxID=1974212 RepID=UPI001A8E6783|nr:mechanosensitive ion channel domain-containing protein [Chroococcus sp. FPU101]GFE69139.1 MscS Mechanosensitive ion channel [Chroococcus sp. FPU101]